ncbi:1-deoxy-D-xylulose-5-phosphate synthase [compost metagenome]
MTMRALEVADELIKSKIGTAVLHVPTIKPLDVQAIIEQCRREGRLVVIAENHTQIGGLGEAIAMTLLQARVQPEVRHVALPDQFLDAGALPTLHDRYGISKDVMVANIQRWLA